MRLLKDFRRMSFYRNKSTDSQLSVASSPHGNSSSPSISNASSADSSPPQSLLVLQDSVQSNTSGTLSFAPIVDNFRQDQTVIYQVILLQGHIPAGPKPDGILTVRDTKQRCPTTTWPVSQSKFKALVYLHPGVNTISLEYAASGSRSVYRSAYKLMYQPMVSAPPLKLILLHAKDSSFASTDNEDDSPILALAKAKYRMSAYLWQCFMAENMNKLGHSRRTFQLETSWDQSTLFAEDICSSVARNQAPVHTVELDRTVAELEGISSTELNALVESTLHRAFKHFGKTKQFFSCLLLDTRLDEQQTVSGPNLTFGGQGQMHQNLHFAVFGGHHLPDYPAAIDEVTSAFVDIASSHSDISKGRSASAGLGEHLRQIGHMLDLPEQAAGIMSDECKRFGNVFSANYTANNKDINLHPLDAIRLRYHPAFDAPWGAPVNKRNDAGVTFWGTSKTSMQISSRAGISAVEIYKSSDNNLCQYWMDFQSKRGPAQNKVDLSFNDLYNATMFQGASRRTSIRKSQSQEHLRLNILTADGKEFPIANLELFARALYATVPEHKLPIFTNLEIGQAAGTATETSTLFPMSSRVLSITVYHTPGSSISGIDFGCELGAKYLVGSRAAESHKEWQLNVAGGEALIGMELTVSKETKRLCGLRLHSNAARVSPWFGAVEGEMTSHMLIPPETFQIIGLRGKQDSDELQSLQFLIDR